MRLKIFIALLGILTLTYAQWVQQHIGTNDLFDLDFPPGNFSIGYACGANSFLLKTMDGENWQPLSQVQPSGNFNAINFPIDEMTGYIACDSGNIEVTNDGGENWQIINTGIQNDLFGIRFRNNELGYAVGANGAVMKTRDQGHSWEDVSIRTTANLYDVAVISEERFFVVGDSGTIAYTMDGGASWQMKPSRVTTDLLAICFAGEQIGWVVGKQKTCLITYTNGERWDPQDVPVPSNTDLYSVIFLDENYGYVCGTLGRIGKSINGGLAWETYNLLYPFTRVEFPFNDQIGWVCGQNEVIYKTTNGGWMEEANLSQGAEEKVLTCTPNPFRTKTSIQLSSPLNNQAALKIYDASGKLVKTLGTTTWDGRNELNQRVIPGIYLLEYKTTNGIIEHQKLTVLE
jgi:photosystem II stability/assembly factor-like uncharacterized protein